MHRQPSPKSLLPRNPRRKQRVLQRNFRRATRVLLPRKKRLAHGPATPEKGNKKGKQDIDGDAMTPEKPGVRKSRIKGKRNLENTEKTAEKPGVRKGDKGTQDSNEMPSTSQSAPAKPDGATSQTSACRPVSFGQPSKVETVLKAPGKRKKKMRRKNQAQERNKK